MGCAVHDVEVVAEVGRVEIRGFAECYYHGLAWMAAIGWANGGAPTMRRRATLR
jgi:hypothetical protein